MIALTHSSIFINNYNSGSQRIISGASLYNVKKTWNTNDTTKRNLSRDVAAKFSPPDIINDIDAVTRITGSAVLSVGTVAFLIAFFNSNNANFKDIGKLSATLKRNDLEEKLIKYTKIQRNKINKLNLKMKEHEQRLKKLENTNEQN